MEIRGQGQLETRHAQHAFDYADDHLAMLQSARCMECYFFVLGGRDQRGQACLFDRDDFAQVARQSGNMRGLGFIF